MLELKTAGTIILLTIPFVLLTILAIVNAAQKDFGGMGKKGLWLMVAAVPFVGWAVYFLFGARKGAKSENAP